MSFVQIYEKAKKNKTKNCVWKKVGEETDLVHLCYVHFEGREFWSQHVDFPVTCSLGGELELLGGSYLRYSHDAESHRVLCCLARCLDDEETTREP